MFGQDLIVSTTPPSHYDWTWLSPVASLIVALVALGGVVWNSKATRDIARQDRADDRNRDYVNWRREQIQQLASEVVRAAENVVGDLNKLASASTVSINLTTATPIEAAARQIAANKEIFFLLSAREAAGRSHDLYHALMDKELLLSAKAYHRALAQERSAGGSFQNMNAATAAALKKFTMHGDKVYFALREFSVAVEAELQQLNPGAAES